MTDHPTPPPAAQTREPLLPCPFCGSPAELERDGDRHGEWFNLGCSRHFGRVDPQCPGGRLWYTESLDGEASAIAAWNKRATPAERPGDAALAEAIRWVSTLEMHSAHIYDRLTPADIQRLDALEDAARRALSPAPRDGGWNAGAEEMRAAASERCEEEARMHWQAGNTAGSSVCDTLAHAITALPLPAPPTEDGR